ncbi:hypothetical protein ACH5RR_036195 [Cinchona calisaya]|uniref:Uncharacterized protein n=1 Tax=Cinchona calisaya TaxID=153742 RepID=A0ABD2Y4V7_9GENT
MPNLSDYYSLSEFILSNYDIVLNGTQSASNGEKVMSRGCLGTSDPIGEVKFTNEHKKEDSKDDESWCNDKNFKSTLRGQYHAHATESTA